MGMFLLLRQHNKTFLVLILLEVSLTRMFSALLYLTHNSKKSSSHFELTWSGRILNYSDRSPVRIS